MQKKHAIVPLALVVALFGALARQPSAREAPSEAQGPQSGPPPSPGSPSAGRSPAPGPSTNRFRNDDGGDRLDTLDVLAESLGIDISTDGLRRRAGWSLNRLGEAGERTSKDLETRARFLKVLLDQPLRDTGPIADGHSGLDAARQAAHRLECRYRQPPDSVCTPSGDVATDVATVDAFLTRYFNEDALHLDAPADSEKLLAQDFERLDKRALEIEVLRRRAEEKDVRIGFLIATLPDPIDSFSGWQFDPMLDAITQAIAANDYLLDRFHFPDAFSHAAGTDATHRESAGGAEHAHELAPAVIVFRKHVDTGAKGHGAEERLVLLVVHENPTAGVHDRSLANAIRLIIRWNGAEATTPGSGVSGGPRRRIKILGPTFSGSSDAMRRALDAVARPIQQGRYQVRLVSGSATDSQNRTTIEGAIEGHVTFQTTVHPDDALFPQVSREIFRAGWNLPIAVLFEANTQYGRQMREVLSRPDLMTPDGSQLAEHIIQLPFPMNISRLRAMAQPERAGAANSLGLPKRFRPLTLMEGPGNPTDQLPQFYPRTTASYVELALAGVLETMRRENVRTVALMATDPRDKLFLAQEIARHLPNVSIFTAESDSLYIHPDYSSFLRGAFVVSTYPLHSANQRWSYGFQGGTERHQFANGSAQGIYNAALALLNYNEQGCPVARDGRILSQAQAIDEHVPRLLEYGTPGEGCQSCQPPIWVSVVGTGSAWPVRAAPGPRSNPEDAGACSAAAPRLASVAAVSGDAASSADVPYVFTVRAETTHRPPAIFPSPLFNALLIVITFATIAYWIGTSAKAVRGLGMGAVIQAPFERSGDTGAGAMEAPLPEPTLARDRDARAPGYRLVCLLGLLLIVLFIGALCYMRWSVEQSRWPAGVALAAALLALFALADLAVRILVQIGRIHLASVRRAIRDVRAGGSTPGRVALAGLGALGIDVRSLSTWGVAAVLIAAAWSVSNLLGYVFDHISTSADGTPSGLAVSDVTSFVTRSVDFGSGVSPTLPVLFLGGALTLWGLAELARVRSPRVALADPAMRPIVLQAIHGDVNGLTGRWELLNRSILALPPSWLALPALAFAATSVFAFDPYFSPLVTIEGPRFGRFVSTALLLVQVTLSLSLLQFVCLWSSLRQLLRRMAWHELAPAYDRVPRELYPTGLFPRVPRLMELQALIAGPLAHNEGIELKRVFQHEMTLGQTPAWSASRTWGRLVGIVSHAPAAVLQVQSVRAPQPIAPAAGAERGDETAQPRALAAGELAAGAGPSAAGQTALVTQTAPGTAGPPAPLVPPPPPPPAVDGVLLDPLPPEAEAGHRALLAMSMTFIVRDALARLGHNLWFISGGVVLVFCSHTLFPFQKDERLALLGWGYIGLTFATILLVLVQMKRNEVLGRLTSKKPGERSLWDGEFVLKIAIFGLLPLITLFAAQFPDVGGVLLHWLEPIQKALP